MSPEQFQRVRSLATLWQFGVACDDAVILNETAAAMRELVYEVLADRNLQLTVVIWSSRKCLRGGQAPQLGTDAPIAELAAAIGVLPRAGSRIAGFIPPGVSGLDYGQVFGVLAYVPGPKWHSTVRTRPMGIPGGVPKVMSETGQHQESL